MSALLIENHSRYLFETSFEYQSTAYHVQSARMELCRIMNMVKELDRSGSFHFPTIDNSRLLRTSGFNVKL